MRCARFEPNGTITADFSFRIGHSEAHAHISDVRTWVAEHITIIGTKLPLSSPIVFVSCRGDESGELVMTTLEFSGEPALAEFLQEYTTLYNYIDAEVWWLALRESIRDLTCAQPSFKKITPQDLLRSMVDDKGVEALSSLSKPTDPRVNDIMALI